MNKVLAPGRMLLAVLLLSAAILRAHAQSPNTTAPPEELARTIASLGRQNLTESVQKNICGKVRRELVPGTIELYPMRGYGAVEMGIHRFHQPKLDPLKPVGEAKFMHLWQNKDGVWKITRVISYDHRSLK